jgi:hypothetical protein
MVFTRHLARFRAAILAAIISVGCGVILLGQIVPDAPIRHFSLPMFGENGYKSWELRGLQGEFLNKEQALIEGLEVVVFSGDGEVREENRIRSPKALIYLSESRAESDSSLFVVGPGYEITGRSWSWDGKKRKIVVREAVRVSFAGTLNILD